MTEFTAVFSENSPHKNKISSNILMLKLIVEYLKKILDSKELTDNKIAIIKSLYKEQIDFRSLNNLKHTIFDSDKVVDN